MSITTSTQTYVIYSEINNLIDLSEICSVISPGMQIYEGEVISIKYGAASSEKSASYLKCLTISFMLSPESIEEKINKQKRGRKPTRVKLLGKLLSIKIFKNGSTQVTGCKSIEHAKICMNMVYNLLKLDKVEKLSLVSVMINVNFDIGFRINREKLGIYFVKNNINVPPLTSGYMGIKIRVPLNLETTELMIPQLSWTKTDKFTELPLIPYIRFFSEDSKKRNKIFTACIGIFQNGKVLMSCVNDQAIKIMSEWIRGFLIEAKPEIEMKDKEIKTFKR